jgi:hypothetical protein
VAVKAIDIRTGEQGEERQGRKEEKIEILYLLAMLNNVFD